MSTEDRSAASRRATPLGRAFRSLLVHFLLLVVPTGVIGVATHAAAVGRLTREFSARSETALGASVREIDSALQAAQELAAQVLSEDLVSRNLAPWDTLSVHHKANLILLAPILARARSASVTLVHNLFLYVDSQRVYTSSGIDEFDDFFGKFYRYDGYPAEHWRRQLLLPGELEILPASRVSGTPGHPQALVVPILVKEPVAGARAVMVLNVSVDAVERILSSRALSGVTEFAVAGADGAPLRGGSRAQALSRAVASGLSKAVIGGRPHVVQGARSLVTGWLYGSATPMAELRRQAGGILRATAMASVALTITSVLLSFVFAYRLYSPVRAISETLSAHAGSIAGQGRRPDEYRIIREGVAELVRATSHLEQRWAALASERGRLFLWHLLRNESSFDPASVDAALAESGMPHPWFVVAVLFARCGGRGADAQAALQSPGLDQAWRGAAAVCLIDSQRDYRIAVLNLESPQGRAQVMASAQAIAASAPLLVGVGRIVRGSGSLGRSLSDALTAARLWDGVPDPAVVDAESIAMSEDLFYPAETENRMLNLLRAGRIASLEHELHATVRENLRRNATHGAMLRLLGAMAASVERTAGSDTAERPPVAVDPMDTDYGARLDDIAAFCARVVSRALRLSTAAADSTVGRIMQYADSHSSDASLCLESIAQHMGLSSKYVSRIFAERTGVHISDYIERARVARAKDLLDRTTLRVAEVGRAVGIPDRTTFARVFRKREGISPREYRRRA